MVRLREFLIAYIISLIVTFIIYPIIWQGQFTSNLVHYAHQEPPYWSPPRHIRTDHRIDDAENNMDNRRYATIFYPQAASAPAGSPLQTSTNLPNAALIQNGLMPSSKQNLQILK